MRVFFGVCPKENIKSASVALFFVSRRLLKKLKKNFQLSDSKMSQIEKKFKLVTIFGSTSACDESSNLGLNDLWYSLFLCITLESN